ncbi:NAD(P)-bd_dom domain-containing protein [Pseudoscourfieldia marina]
MASSSCSSARLTRASRSQATGRVGYNGARPLRHCHVSASASSSSIVVAGAAGQTGVRVVERLVERGFHVKAIVRDADKAKETLDAVMANAKSGSVEIVKADLTKQKDAEAIRAALEGAQAAVWAADTKSLGIVPGPLGIAAMAVPALRGMVPKPKADFTALTNFLDAAKEVAKPNFRLAMLTSAAVTRLGWHEDKQKHLDSVVDIPIVRLNPFGVLDVQREAEEVVRTYGISYAIVRPVGLKDDDSWPPARPVLAQGDVLVGRANRRDVADVLIAAATLPECEGKTFEMATITGYPPNDEGLAPSADLLKTDKERVAMGEDLGLGAVEYDATSAGEAFVDANRIAASQLLPGMTQDATKLEMGRTYEQLDRGEVNRESGTEATPRERALAATGSRRWFAPPVPNQDRER